MTTKLAWSVPSLAESVDVSPSLIWKEIADGELETISVGDRTLITVEQRERWLKRKAERARQRRAARQQRRAELSPENAGLPGSKNRS
jgi:hypothetical protein